MAFFRAKQAWDFAIRESKELVLPYAFEPRTPLQKGAGILLLKPAIED
jgi:hypothetical protein